MKSVKPGRGPSMESGIGSVFAVIVGIIWCFGAAQIGAPVPFVLFGVIFIIVAAVQAYIGFHNATSENRWSAYDITDEEEEPDPLNEKYEKKQEQILQVDDTKGGYCPYCGMKVEKDYAFCRKCGKKL